MPYPMSYKRSGLNCDESERNHKRRNQNRGSGLNCEMRNQPDQVLCLNLALRRRNKPIFQYRFPKFTCIISYRN